MPTYLAAVIIVLPVWVFLYWRRKDLRRKMLIMSLLTSLLAVTDLFFIPEYWRPVVLWPVLGGKVDLLAFLFCFEFGGIGAVFYEEIMGERAIREPKNRHHPLKLLGIVSPLMLIILRLFTSWNFMTDTLVSLAVGVLILVVVRGDLAKDVLIGGLLLVSLYGVMIGLYLVAFPFVVNVWNFQSYPQIMVGNIPHAELFWAFLTGAYLGPIYEFVNDLDVRKLPRKR